MMPRSVFFRILPVLIAFFLLAGPVWAGPAAGQGQTTPQAGAPVIKAVPVAALPHNPEHFTQGLFFYQGHLYESTGLYGQSVVAIKDPVSGASRLEKRLNPRLFGEGAAVANGQIYVLTWREQVGLILDPETLRETGRFQYQGQGWGLTWDGTRLIRSDGGSWLYYHDLDGRSLGRLQVREAERPVEGLNELEWIDGEKLILANIFMSDRIAAIAADSGQVLFWLDLADIKPAGLSRPGEDVTNGIALGPDGRTLWVTGKRWPVIYVLAWPVR